MGLALSEGSLKWMTGMCVCTCMFSTELHAYHKEVVLVQQKHALTRIHSMLTRVRVCRHTAGTLLTAEAYERWLALVLVVAAEVHTALKQMQAGGMTHGSLMHRDVKPGNVLAFSHASSASDASLPGLSAPVLKPGVILKVRCMSTQYAHTSVRPACVTSLGIHCPPLGSHPVSCRMCLWACAWARYHLQQQHAQTRIRL